MNMLLAASLLTFLLVAALYWFIPYVTPKNIQFGVRIPRSRESDPVVGRLRREFHLLLVTVITVIFALLILLPWSQEAYWITPLSMPFEIMSAYLIYFKIFRKLRALKGRENWFSGMNEAVGATYPEEPALRSSFAGILMIIPAAIIIAVTFYIGMAIYPSLPAVFATHFGANGQPNGYSTKSIGTVFMLAFLQVGLTAFMFLLGYAITRTRQETDVSRPEISYEQQEKIRLYSRDTLYLFSTMINLSLMFGSLNIWQLIPSGYSMLLTLSSVLLGVVALSIVMMSMGQMGSRVAVPNAQEENSGLTNKNDDKYWKGGALYYNRDDPSLLVGKRLSLSLSAETRHQ